MVGEYNERMKKYYTQVIEEILNGAIRATKYVSTKEVVRAVRRTYKANGRNPSKSRRVEITLTIGQPNYLERDFIALCKKAGEPFPVKKVQVKLYNPKK